MFQGSRINDEVIGGWTKVNSANMSEITFLSITKISNQGARRRNRSMAAFEAKAVETRDV